MKRLWIFLKKMLFLNILKPWHLVEGIEGQGMNTTKVFPPTSGKSKSAKHLKLRCSDLFAAKKPNPYVTIPSASGFCHLWTFLVPKNYRRLEDSQGIWSTLSMMPTDSNESFCFCTKFRTRKKHQITTGWKTPVQSMLPTSLVQLIKFQTLQLDAFHGFNLTRQ